MQATTKEDIKIINWRKIISASYTIYGKVLEVTSKAKYLGATIDI